MPVYALSSKLGHVKKKKVCFLGKWICVPQIRTCKRRTTNINILTFLLIKIDPNLLEFFKFSHYVFSKEWVAFEKVWKEIICECLKYLRRNLKKSNAFSLRVCFLAYQHKWNIILFCKYLAEILKFYWKISTVNITCYKVKEQKLNDAHFIFQLMF